MNKKLCIGCLLFLIMITGCSYADKVINNDMDETPGIDQKIENDFKNEDNSIRNEAYEVNINIPSNKEPIIDAYNIPYPRLGMWWLDVYEESAESIARYDLLLNEMDEPELIDKLKEIRQLNNDMILLRPISPSEQIVYFDYNKDWPNPVIKDLPTEFFLMHTGTFISEDIDVNDKWVSVDQLYTSDGHALFMVGDDVAIGSYESARITKIDAKENKIKLDRGYGRAASSHESGSGIRAHVRFWPGTWVMNITSACPKLKVKGVSQPIDYISYFHLVTQNKVEGLDEALENDYLYINHDQANYDGFIIDRFEDSQSWLSWIGEEYRPIDPYLENEVISEEVFNEIVKETVDQYTSLLKDTYDVPIIIRNNPSTIRHEIHQGQVYESFGWPEVSTSFWQNLFGGESEIISEYDEEKLTYLGWTKLAKDPLLVMEVYDDESVPEPNSQGEYDNPFDQEDFRYNEKRFRLSFTSTLLGNGFYSYEINTNGHGSLGLMWFDAYDLGSNQQGYLGHPYGEYDEVEENIYMRSFENGLVLVNVSNKDIKPIFDQILFPVNGFNGDVIESLDGCIYLYDTSSN